MKTFKIKNKGQPISRRTFNTIFSLGLANIALPQAKANRGPKIVIIGGGIGGVNVARILALKMTTWKITLIEPNKVHITPFGTNHYLTGTQNLHNFSYHYNTISQISNIEVIHDWVTSIDPEKRKVKLKKSKNLTFDKLIIATGIGLIFDSIEGYDFECSQLFPHAYEGTNDSQWKLLFQQIRAMPNGGLMTISVPKRPYRCTPAPYERASLIAEYLKREKPKSKILLLDSKNEFPLMDMILEIWNKDYGNLIEWVSADFGGEIIAIDKKNKTLISTDEKFTADVINIIPPQFAGNIASESGLTDNTGWCPINGSTFESTLIPNIHLIGDIINAGDMPKSASSAISQAQHLAAAILAEFARKSHIRGQLKNSCFFFTGSQSAVIIGGEYYFDGNHIVGQRGYSSDIDENKHDRQQNAIQAHNWYKDITQKTFLK